MGPASAAARVTPCPSPSALVTPLPALASLPCHLRNRFYPGELVTGTIHLNLVEPAECICLDVKVGTKGARACMGRAGMVLQPLPPEYCRCTVGQSYRKSTKHTT